MASNWQMPSPGSACVQCGHVFDCGEAFQAYLYEAAEGYQRQDYCQNCRPGDEPVPLATWKTHRPLPTPRKVQPFDREAVYSFFRRLEDAAEPAQVQFRFVLALLLWRKRVLSLVRSTVVGEREYWEFGRRAADETHRVERPALEEEELERLSMQLEQLLATTPGELDTAAAGQQEQSDE